MDCPVEGLCPKSRGAPAISGPPVRISISLYAGIPTALPLNRFFRLENMPTLYHYRIRCLEELSITNTRPQACHPELVEGSSRPTRETPRNTGAASLSHSVRTGSTFPGKSTAGERLGVRSQYQTFIPAATPTTAYPACGTEWPRKYVSIECAGCFQGQQWCATLSGCGRRCGR